VNFGLPDTTGRTLTPAHIEQLVKAVEDAIRKYEPRIRLDRSRPVRATERGEHGRLCLEIRGELKSEPAPEWLCIETQIDVETGDCDVVETSGDPDE
jgi:predicted component of type VI protein secretion system